LPTPSAGPQQLERPLGEQLAQGLAVGVDQRLQIGDEAPRERVRHDRARGDQAGRRVDDLAALADDVLHHRHDLPEPVERHPTSISLPHRG
jgi:hypothetical protein